MRSRHYTCYSCGATKVIHDPHRSNKFPPDILCRIRGCRGFAVPTRCDIYGCDEEYYLGQTVHVILNEVQHTFQLCYFHYRLTCLDLIRPIKVEKGLLRIEALPAIRAVP